MATWREFENEAPDLLVVELWQPGRGVRVTKRR